MWEKNSILDQNTSEECLELSLSQRSRNYEDHAIPVWTRYWRLVFSKPQFLTMKVSFPYTVTFRIAIYLERLHRRTRSTFMYGMNSRCGKRRLFRVIYGNCSEHFSWLSEADWKTDLKEPLKHQLLILFCCRDSKACFAAVVWSESTSKNNRVKR